MLLLVLYELTWNSPPLGTSPRSERWPKIP